MFIVFLSMYYSLPGEPEISPHFRRAPRVRNDSE